MKGTDIAKVEGQWLNLTVDPTVQYQKPRQQPQSLSYLSLYTSLPK